MDDRSGSMARNASSPLQVLEISLALLRQKHPTETRLLDRADRSTTKLKGLKAVLENESQLFYQSKRGISFDPQKNFGRKLRKP